jgi:hypothetical protein
MTDIEKSKKEHGQAPKSTRRKKKKKLSEAAAVAKLWEAGYLKWKLRGKQNDIYDHFKGDTDDISACLVSRQFGKSFVLCLIAIELCLQIPGAIVKYACPQQKMVERIIKPRVKEIIKDCPDELKPEWKTQEKVWVFPNGSEIQVAGTDNGNYDNLRGGSAHLCICDEAGFMSELETVVFSVLAPTTDTTGGKIYLASTPNDKDPNHDFHEFFVYPLEAAGKLLKFTFYDSPMVDDEAREKIIKRYPGGIANVKFRCEYLCEIPNVTEASVIPEFNAVSEVIVKEVDIPEYCDFYTSMDIGFNDLTVVLFGYYDYFKATLVILDEYVINGKDTKTDVIAKNVKNKEKLHYIVKRGDQTEEQKAYLRYSDNNNLILLNELARTYEVQFFATEKRNKEQYVDLVRRWVEQKRIIIHPRCKNLLYHIRHAQWHFTKQGTFTGKFKNLKGNDSAGLLPSHADALDALIYMARNVQTGKNPYPNDYGLNINENTFVSNKWKSKNKSQAVDFMKKVFNLNKK